MTVPQYVKHLDPIHAHYAWRSSVAKHASTRTHQRLCLERRAGNRLSVAQSTFAMHKKHGVYLGNRVADALCWVTGEGVLPRHMQSVIPPAYRKSWAPELRCGVLTHLMSIAAVAQSMAQVFPFLTLIGAGNNLMSASPDLFTGLVDGSTVAAKVACRTGAVIGKVVAVPTGHVGLVVRAACRGAGYALGAISGSVAACYAAASFRQSSFGAGLQAA